MQSGYDPKLHRDDRTHAKSRGLQINAEVRARWSQTRLKRMYTISFELCLAIKLLSEPIVKHHLFAISNQSKQSQTKDVRFFER